MTTHRPDDPWSGLLALVRRLRGPDGCPWDREQTVSSLAPYLVEEAFEVLHAVEDGANEKIREESGDLAFVLSLFLLTAEQEGRGTIEGTLGNTVGKIQDRHPHVFPPPAEASTGAPQEASTGASHHDPAEPGRVPEAQAISRTLQLEWERIKRREADDGDPHRLPLPHPALPALAQAAKLQKKAANLGFDWPDVTPVFAKVQEELAELEEARTSGTVREVQEEFGDLLFAVVNLSRFLDLDAESSLRRANEKFRQRFHEMLSLMESEGHDPLAATLGEMDGFWERAKQAGRERGAAGPKTLEESDS
jgi:ATP diphosphatase